MTEFYSRANFFSKFAVAGIIEGACIGIAMGLTIPIGVTISGWIAVYMVRILA